MYKSASGPTFPFKGVASVTTAGLLILMRELRLQTFKLAYRVKVETNVVT